MINLAKNDRVGEIDIYGTIGDLGWGGGVDPLKFKQELAALGELDRLNVHIHSYGGFVYEGWAIFNALDTHPAEVHVYVDGSAMSMASVILMAGDVKHIAKNGTVMIHNPLSIAMGESKDFRKAADELDKIRDQIVRAYIDGGVKVSAEEIMQMMDEETYLDAEEAVLFGFADVIGEESATKGNPEATARALVSAHLSTLSGMPANLMEQVNMTQTANSPATDSTNQEAINAAAQAAAAQAHKRYSDIMALSRPGLEKFVKNLADDTNVTVADAKMRVADEVIRVHDQNLSQSRNDRNGVVAAENGESVQTNSLQERWEKNQGNVQEQFLDFEGFKAFEAANSKGLVKMLGKK